VSDALRLASELIRIPSPNPPWDERAVAEHLAAWLRERRIDARVLGVEAADSQHASVFARLPGVGGRPPFVLCGHLDTVPAGEGAWTRDPYAPAVDDGRLYGLGAADMKGGVAAMAVAAARIAHEARSGRLPQGDLLLAFTSGEETRSNGARALAQAGLLDGAGGIVIGEPTGNAVGVAEKGGIWLDLVVTGRTAHGSLPHLGANAVAALADVLVRLEQAVTQHGPIDGVSLSKAQGALREALVRPAHELLGAPTLAATRIAGGVASNVVPDRASAVLDIRTLPGQAGAEVMERVRGVAAEVAARRGVVIDVTSPGERVALAIDPGHPLARACAEAVERVVGRRPAPMGLTGATDATELVPHLGVPFVICGPGEMAQAHQPDEWVSVVALEQSVEVYYHLARAMVG
jgi:succinyl-diaminopimelate desuccinylase